MPRTSACLAATVVLLLMVIAYLTLVRNNVVYYVTLNGDVRGDVDNARGGNITCAQEECVILTTQTVSNNNNTGREDKPRGQCIVAFMYLFSILAGLEKMKLQRRFERTKLNTFGEIG